MAEHEMKAEEKALDALFGAAKLAAPVADPVFMERLAADMEALVPQAASTPRRTGAATGLFERFKMFFAASGLTGAAALGVWIGFVMPETLNTLAAGYDTTEAIGIGAFLPSADLMALDY